MRNVQFYYTYCYTKYRKKINLEVNFPPALPKNKMTPHAPISNEKKLHLLIKVYRYHLSENDPLKKNPQLLMLQIRKKTQERNSQQRLKIHKTNVKKKFLYFISYS